MSTITLKPDRTQYTSTSQRIEVKMEQGWRSNEFSPHVGAKANPVTLTCTIQHGVEVRVNQNQLLFASGSSTTWTWTGHIRTVSKGFPQWDAYTFDHTINTVPTIAPAFNPDDPQYANLQKLSFTLMFEAFPNATTNLELVLPVSRDWAGTLTISFTDTGGNRIGIQPSPLRLVNQPWGLPSVRSQLQTIHPRATYGAQPGNLLVELYNDASEDPTGGGGHFMICIMRYGMHVTLSLLPIGPSILTPTCSVQRRVGRTLITKSA